MRETLAASTDRWFRVGRSTASDAATAGAEAAREALAGEKAALMLVFCAAAYDVSRLLEGVCSVTPDEVVIVGGTTNGELGQGGPTATGVGLDPGVVVTVLGGPGFTVASVVVPDASTDRRSAGAAAASVMARIDAPNRVLLMIADGLTREQHELVRGAYSVLGLEVPIVGGCSADELDYGRTYQFHGSGAGVEARADSLVAIALGSTARMGIGIAHGWVKQGAPMLVTAGEKGEVFELDDAPALDVYLRCLSADRTLAADVQTFREFTFQHPLGMSRRTGEDIRVVHSVDAERGSLLCLADVPQGSLVWTMSAEVDSLVQAANDSCAMAIRGLGEAPPRGVLVFDCGARKQILGPENLLAEQAAIAVAAGGAPFGGFYTFGEFGRTHGSRGMHHLTVVTLALA